MITERFDLCQVHLSKTLRDAMVALDRGAAEIALVTDSSGTLIGTLTDGDIRRALLRGKSLDSELAPHVTRQFTAVGPDTPRAEVLDLMRARSIAQIPVVGGGGHLLGLHLLRELLGAVERPNWAVIMAGGKGTRLKPLTEHVPKPMLTVAGRPILERLVLHLVGFGIRRIFLAINYLGHVVEGHFGDGSRLGCTIDYLRETSPLGTGGALSLLPETSRDPLIVCNGDLVTQANFGEMLDFHGHGGQIATMGIRRYFHTIPFGCVDLDGSRITRIDEKPQLSRMVNAGIYVLDPSLPKRIPMGEAYTLPALIEDCIGRGETVAGFEINDDWIDVGQREQLKQAREGQSQT
jgi:dTDP-glucose pyrophosphorylase